MTETTTNEAAKKQQAEEKAKRDKANKEAAENLAKQTPTPPQEENDRAATGEHITEHADDGSGPDPNATTKQSEPKRAQGGGYATRDARPRE
jgi:hypothetical protein